jgi:lysophospholipase L1-like esterase
LSLAGCLIALLLLELGARLLPTPYPPDTGKFFACHNTLGWTGAPYFQGVLEDARIYQELAFNAQGMHDTDHAPEKPPGTFRILMLGDSFVQALQVGEAETAHQLLENRLNQASPPGRASVEVISAGVVNWGTNQQLVYYREQGQFFRPDLVLLMFYLGNDFQDNLPGNGLTVQGVNCYAPYFGLCEGQLVPSPLAYAPGLPPAQDSCSPFRQSLAQGAGQLYSYSRLYRQLDPLLVSRRPRQAFGQEYDSPYSALYLPNDEAVLEQAWQITEATLAQLRREVEAGRGRLAVGLISPDIIIRLARLSPAEQDIFLRDNPIFAQAQIDRPNQRLAAFLEQQDIPFLDLAPPMVDHLAANPSPLYFLGEGHWTAEGNRVAADALARWLVENNFFDQGR